jgi:hypothetical protein
MNAAFVAAARWARVNGWKPARTDWADRRDYSWRNGGVNVVAYPMENRDWALNVILFRRDGNIAPLETVVTSLAQALDYLVVAGVLPASFASWGHLVSVDSLGDGCCSVGRSCANGCGVVPAVDWARDSVWLTAGNEITWVEGEQDMTPHGYTRLYRRVRREES